MASHGPPASAPGSEALQAGDAGKVRAYVAAMTVATRLPNRAVLDASGPDTPDFLERLVTCRTDDMPVGEARYGALLTPQGKIIADFILQRTETGFLMDVAVEAREALRKRLTMFKLRAKVEIAMRDDLAVCLDEGGFADPRSEALPNRAFSTDLDAQPAGANYNTARIRAGIAEFGLDFAEADVFAADINMDMNNGIDFKKGCFVGQEVASRMKRRGTARRRTLPVRAPGIEAGMSVMGETPIGDVTSNEGDLGLARIRIDRLARADAVSIGDAPAEILAPDWLDAETEALA